VPSQFRQSHCLFHGLIEDFFHWFWYISFFSSILGDRLLLLSLEISYFLIKAIASYYRWKWFLSLDYHSVQCTSLAAFTLISLLQLQISMPLATAPSSIISLSRRTITLVASYRGLILHLWVPTVWHYALAANFLATSAIPKGINRLCARISYNKHILVFFSDDGFDYSHCRFHYAINFYRPHYSYLRFD
jgi:uncharacterized membrane protein (UPF0182 family)